MSSDYRSDTRDRDRNYQPSPKLDDNRDKDYDDNYKSSRYDRDSRHSKRDDYYDSRDQDRHSLHHDRSSRRYDERDYDYHRSSAGSKKDSKDRDYREGSSKDRDYREGSSKDRDYREGSSKDRDYREGSSKDRDYREGSSKDRDYREGSSRSRDYKEDSSKTRDDKSRDERYKDDKSRDERYKDDRHKEDRYRDDRYKDDKSREDIHKDDKHRDDRHNDYKHRDDRHKDDKYRDRDRDRDDQYRDDKRSSDRDRSRSDRDSHENTSSSKQKVTKSTGYALPIPIHIVGYSNHDNPFGTENLDKQFFWKKRDQQRQSLNLPVFIPTTQSLINQAELMKGLVLEVKLRRLENLRDRDQKLRLREQISRDLELIQSQDYELEQARNALLHIYKQCEIRALNDSETPFHAFIKYPLFKLKMINKDIFKFIGISAADSQIERDRHDHFVNNLLDVQHLLDLNDVVTSLTFDELLHLYSGISKMIDLTQKTILYQGKQKQKNKTSSSSSSSTSDNQTSLNTTSPLDNLTIVTIGDLDFWIALQHLLSREIDVKYLTKMGFSIQHAHFIIMSADKNTRLNFTKINGRYKRWLNDSVTQTMITSQRHIGGALAPQQQQQHQQQQQQQQQSQPPPQLTGALGIYSQLDGLYAVPQLIGDITIASGHSNRNNSALVTNLSSDDPKSHHLQQQQAVIDQCVPLEWILSSSSLVPLTSVEEIYEALHTGVKSLGEIAKWKKAAEREVANQGGGLMVKNEIAKEDQSEQIILQGQSSSSSSSLGTDSAAFWSAFLIELSYAEAKSMLDVFGRRLRLMRAVQLQKVADRTALPIQTSTTPVDSTPAPLLTDQSHQGDGQDRLQPQQDQLSSELQKEFLKRQDDDANEAGIIDVALPTSFDHRQQQQPQSVNFHSTKFITRKPRFISKVKTGVNWSKYNRTHYDRSNPPPASVQGYRFEIFYPDLLDTIKNSPKYTIVYDDNDMDYCLIRFSAGPPYEDIAFRIVRKRWDTRYTRSSFSKGILTLVFSFSRVGYRR